MRRVIVENSGRRGKLESREEGVVIAEHTRGIPSIRLGTLRWGDTVVRAKLIRNSNNSFARNVILWRVQKYHSCLATSIIEAPKVGMRRFEMRAKCNGFLARCTLRFPLDYANEGTRPLVLSSQPLTEISRDIAAVIAENTQGWSFPARSPTSLCQLVRASVAWFLVAMPALTSFLFLALTIFIRSTLLSPSRKNLSLWIWWVFWQQKRKKNIVNFFVNAWTLNSPSYFIPLVRSLLAKMKRGYNFIFLE